MFRFGICRMEDYCPEPSTLTQRLRKVLTGNNISLRLLRTGVPATPREVEVFEAIMHDLRLNNGVYRTTFHGRFENLDEFVNELLMKRFPCGAPLDVHDWAASDCLTAAEWAASILAIYPEANFHASDLALFLIEVSFSDGATLILEPDGAPLQYIVSPFVFRLDRPEASRGLLDWLLAPGLRSKLDEVKARVAVPQEWLDSSNQTLAQPPFLLRKLSMVHPDAEALRARDRRFSIGRHSAFDSLVQPVDVIRSMNIFNLSYFTPERLAEGARAVQASLKPGGWWIVGRTWREKPPASNVSILEKQANGFRLVERFGEGSEVESIALTV